ncbi:MAG TPA: hypothetical protein DCR55_04355 [Lentisphaeria bacterium]|jgi:bacteriocin biosynthesis cyclodehydratase domain-containing protein|nr:hypothetical protein [Lentisphaeria bacterium]
MLPELTAQERAVSAMAANIAVLEGIKVLAGLGETLAGTLLTYDALTMSFMKVPLARRPDCPICRDV